MKRKQIVIKTIYNAIEGYSVLPNFCPTEDIIFEVLVRILPKKSRYVKHFVRQEFVKDLDLPYYIPTGIFNENKDIKIPRGKVDFILTVFYE